MKEGTSTASWEEFRSHDDLIIKIEELRKHWKDAKHVGKLVVLMILGNPSLTIDSDEILEKAIFELRCGWNDAQHRGKSIKVRMVNSSKRKLGAKVFQHDGLAGYSPKPWKEAMSSGKNEAAHVAAPSL